MRERPLHHPLRGRSPAQGWMTPGHPSHAGGMIDPALPLKRGRMSAQSTNARSITNVPASAFEPSSKPCASSIAASSLIISIEPHSITRSVSGSSFCSPRTGSPNSAASSISVADPAAWCGTARASRSGYSGTASAPRPDQRILRQPRRTARRDRRGRSPGARVCTTITCSNSSYTSGSRARLRNGARPVPVEKQEQPLAAAAARRCTSVPVGFLPRYTSSPGWISWSCEVSGPSGTLIDRNSSSSA